MPSTERTGKNVARIRWPIDDLGMLIMRISPRKVRWAVQATRQNALPFTLEILKMHFLAGGDLERLVQIALRTQQAGLDTSAEMLSALELGDEDIQAFIDRGGHTAAQAHKVDLVSRWDSDIAAARELRALYRDELSKVEYLAPNLLKQMAGLELPSEEVTEIDEEIAKSVRHLSEEIDRIERRWPELG